jgi:electron transfer flavoprotein alpha/beta subunit
VAVTKATQAQIAATFSVDDTRAFRASRGEDQELELVLCGKLLGAGEQDQVGAHVALGGGGAWASSRSAVRVVEAHLGLNGHKMRARARANKKRAREAKQST